MQKWKIQKSAPVSFFDNWEVPLCKFSSKIVKQWMGSSFLKFVFSNFLVKTLYFCPISRPFFPPTANLKGLWNLNRCKLESQWAPFETRKDRSITCVKMKEKEEIRFYPPTPLTHISPLYLYEDGKPCCTLDLLSQKR